MYTYPLLQRVSELYSEAELSNVLLLACQHLLEPQQRMFEHLIKLGLKPENCVIVGKNYSTNSEVLKKLCDLGCVVAPFSDKFEAEQPFDQWFENRLTSFISAEISCRPMGEYRKVIILDDGGFMHLIVDKLCGQNSNIVGVEQTSSGHHRIKAHGVHFPFISVARSYHKLLYESPYIGINGKVRIVKHLRKVGNTTPRILFLGLGPIGRLVAGQLLFVEKHEGCVFDPKFDEMRYGSRDQACRGVFDFLRPEHVLRSEDLTSRLQEFDVVVGSTGTSVLTEIDIERLHPSTTLISMSSSDREFPAVPFRHNRGHVHENYKLGGRTLVNGGFPITFDGRSHGMPPAQIELTISLLMIRVLSEVAVHLQSLPHAIDQIHKMWRPDEEEKQWYETLNSLD